MQISQAKWASSVSGIGSGEGRARIRGMYMGAMGHRKRRGFLDLLTFGLETGSWVPDTSISGDPKRRLQGRRTSTAIRRTVVGIPGDRIGSRA